MDTRELCGEISKGVNPASLGLGVTDVLTYRRLYPKFFVNDESKKVNTSYT